MIQFTISFHLFLNICTDPIYKSYNFFLFTCFLFWTFPCFHYFFDLHITSISIFLLLFILKVASCDLFLYVAFLATFTMFQDFPNSYFISDFVNYSLCLFGISSLSNLQKLIDLNLMTFVVKWLLNLWTGSYFSLKCIIKIRIQNLNSDQVIVWVLMMIIVTIEKFLHLIHSVSQT